MRGNWQGGEAGAMRGNWHWAARRAARRPRRDGSPAATARYERYSSLIGSGPSGTSITTRPSSTTTG
jgi:hypothetical protein